MINEALDLLIRALTRGELTASIAILLVLMLRLPARRYLGSGLAYRLWALPAVAALASLFPTLPEFMRGTADEPAMSIGLFGLGAMTLLKVWGVGAAAFIAVLLISEHQFRRRVAKGSAGPAVMGFGWLRLVLPDDFRARFTETERDFILRHERMHIARRDSLTNLLIGLAQAISWFNPLAHLAAACARLDQELACDEAVVSDRPETRRAYAETLLKAQLTSPLSPFACAFASRIWAGAGRHPLEVRLCALARPQPGLIRYLLGGVTVSALALCIVAVVWTLSPERPAGSGLAWEDLPATPSAAPTPLPSG